MKTIRDDIARLSSRIAEIDAEIEELSTKIDDRANPRSNLYRAMYREHLRLRNTAARKLNDLTASESAVAVTENVVCPPPAGNVLTLKSSAGRLFAVR